MRSKTAPSLKRPGSTGGSSRRGMRAASSRSMFAPTEEELWEQQAEYDADPEETQAPDFFGLLTPALIRKLSKHLSPAQRKNKGGEKVAAQVFQHWLHLKMLQHSAQNPYGVQPQNCVEVPPELLDLSPTLEDYVDGLATIVTLKSGGVWDVDQKMELLAQVYGTSKPGHLSRDELALLLKKHAKVVPPPPPKKFASEEEELEYERKLKRGEIVVEKHMTQHE